MYSDIWVEVTNVKVTSAGTEVQLRNDRDTDRERARWWSFSLPQAGLEFKHIAEALEKKRPVFAQIRAEANPATGVQELAVAAISVQYAETIR